MKKCSKCGEGKPATLEYFNKNGERLRPNCKSCFRKQTKEYKERNKDKIKEYKKEYYEQNKDKCKERSKEYYEQNKDKFKEYKKEYREQNKDKFVTYNQKRRTLKKQLPATLTPEQWEAIKNKFNNSCAYCEKHKKLEQEHFIPLSKGGEYTEQNIIPACKSCNSSKLNIDFHDWYPTFKHYTKEREQKILGHLESVAK